MTDYKIFTVRDDFIFRIYMTSFGSLS